MTLMRRPIRQAFTLIELLVVIAIIAILTAILLPVFASVREGARQGTSISNMKDIQQKMEQFKLDNHRYPDVLFGYSDGNGSMKDALRRAQAMGNTPAGIPYASVYFPGLYPAYIKDVEVFTDPNNTVNSSDTGQYTGQLVANIIAPCNAANDGTLNGTGSSNCSATANPAPRAGYIVGSPSNSPYRPTTRNFYLADAYDSSPVVTGTNTISSTDNQYRSGNVIRYQLAREQTGSTDSAYVDQLRWQNPPSETLITATTYHVKNADKVLMMFESGAVKKATGHDFAALDASNASPTFWQVGSANYPANLKP